MEHTDISI